MQSGHSEIGSKQRGRSLGRAFSAGRSADAGDGPQRVSWRELALVACALGVIGAGVFGSHIEHRGFFYDDWANLSLTRWPANGRGFAAAVRDAFNTFGYRPALAVYLPALYTVLDDRMALHLAWIVALAAGLSTAFYVLLRELAFPRAISAGLAALVLVFPYSDSTRLWVTAGTGSLTTLLFVTGVIFSLRGFDERDRRRSLRFHALGASLYLVSMLFAEVAAAAIPSLFLLYAYRANWRRALRRTLLEISINAIPAYYIASNSKIPQAASGLTTRISRIRVLADQGLTVATRTLDPWLSQSRNLILWLSFLVVAVAAVYALWGPDRGVRRDLRRWLLALPAALITLAAAYAIYIPADPYYVPLQAGVGNRVNVLAALALVTAAAAIVALVCTLVTAPLPSAYRRIAATCLTVVALLPVGVRYVQIARADAAQYDRAFDAEQSILGTLRETLQVPRHSSTIYVVGHPIFEGPGVPVFAASWDLRGAVRYLYGDPSLVGLPILPGVQFVCSHTGVYPTGVGYGLANGARYGLAYLFEMPAGRVIPIGNRDACHAAVATAIPGPFQAEGAPSP
jgi:hypothetical protein